VLCPIRPHVGPLRPVFNICDRYPWICEGVFRWPRLPIPFPDPPFNDPRIFGGLTGRGRPQADGECNCQSADGEFDEAALVELAMLLLARAQDRR
jgi:hypothetical protein